VLVCWCVDLLACWVGGLVQCRHRVDVLMCDVLMSWRVHVSMLMVVMLTRCWIDCMVLTYYADISMC
jgi:hypothetical protein